MVRNLPARPDRAATRKAPLTQLATDGGWDISLAISEAILDAFAAAD
jgi:hypothetical protein